jgi:hypothetical protein
VLGALLGVRAQGRFQGAIRLRVRSARPRAGEGARLDTAVLDPRQHLRRCPGDGAVAVLQEIHVRRRVDHAQRAVDREGVGPAVHRVLPREHDLEDVAGGDVLAGARHSAQKVCAVAQNGSLVRFSPGTRRRVAGGTPEVRLQRVERGLRQRIRGPAAAFDVGDQDQPLARVIEGDQRPVEGEGRDRLRAGRVPRGDLLEQADGVVGEVANGAAGETRQIGNVGRARSDTRADRGQEIAVYGLAASGTIFVKPGGMRFEGRQRVSSQERVAGEPFAAGHAFQQERARRSRADGAERGDGRHEVAGHLAEDGHQAAGGGETVVLVEAHRPHEADLRAASTSSTRAKGTRRCARTTIRW